MIFPRVGVFLSIQLSIILVDSKALAPRDDYIHNYCLYYTDSNASSKFVSNLNTLLPSMLVAGGNGYNFYNSSCCGGDDEADKAYALALCRADLEPEDCTSCINYASNNLTLYCPDQKEAVTWYDSCMLHYSNNSLYGKLDYYPFFFSWDIYNVSALDVDVFYKLFIVMVTGLSSEAATRGSLAKFASGNVTYPTSDETLYALVQCTPDLSEQNCTACLTTILHDVNTYTYGKRMARIMRPSCSLRYQRSVFTNATAFKALPQNSTGSYTAPPAQNSTVSYTTPPPSNSTTVSGGKKQVSISPIVILVVVAAIVVALVLMASIFIYLRMRKTKQNLEASGQGRNSTTDSLQFDFGCISVATNEFSELNKLGQGGFGIVYRGRLPNDENIAVKRLSRDSPSGNLEFKNEVELLAKLQHRNLVRLLGFCLEGNEKLIIYEFVPNASLDHFIFDPIKREQLSWDIRYKIIIGIGRGLLYLHEDSRLRIIHRDLKTSNILLDAEMDPKIADFGTARLFDLDQTLGETSRIVGTYGYMAPEYLINGQFSVKSDVFSFGVLLLEIVCGKRNKPSRHGEKEENLLSCAWKSWKEGTASSLIDPTLRDGSEAALKCIYIGLLCVQQRTDDRPTMAEVGQMLINNFFDLPVPSQPAFFMYGGIGSSSDMSYSGATRSDESNNSNSVQI